METVTSDEGDAEAWTTLEENETLLLSIAIDVCTRVADVDRLVVTESSGVRAEELRVSLGVSTILSVKNELSVVPFSETGGLTGPVSPDTGKTAANEESIVDTSR